MDDVQVALGSSRVTALIPPELYVDRDRPGTPGLGHDGGGAPRLTSPLSRRVSHPARVGQGEREQQTALDAKAHPEQAATMTSGTGPTSRGRRSAEPIRALATEHGGGRGRHAARLRFAERHVRSGRDTARWDP